MSAARAASSVRSTSVSECAADTNMASNCDGGRGDAALEHGVEVGGKRVAVGPGRALVVDDQTLGEEQRHHRAGAVEGKRTSRLRHDPAISLLERCCGPLDSVVRLGPKRARSAWRCPRRRRLGSRRASQP